MARQLANEDRPIDDQVRPLELNRPDPAVGAQLEPPDLVDNRSLADGSQEVSHPAGDDERSRGGIEPLGLLENTHVDALAGEEVGREQSRGRGADDRNALHNGSLH